MRPRCVAISCDSPGTHRGSSCSKPSSKVTGGYRFAHVFLLEAWSCQGAIVVLNVRLYPGLAGQILELGPLLPSIAGAPNS